MTWKIVFLRGDHGLRWIIGTSYDLDVLHQCGKRVKSKSQKVLRVNYLFPAFSPFKSVETIINVSSKITIAVLFLIFFSGVFGCYIRDQLINKRPRLDLELLPHLRWRSLRQLLAASSLCFYKKLHLRYFTHPSLTLITDIYAS